MRILVTGAAGMLGQVLLPRLAALRHDVVALDVREGTAPGTWLQADLRELEQVRRASEGVELVVHGAALHGIHLATHSPADFFELNVRGTFNVWQAAVEQKVRGFVFSSTMGVYGESRKPVGPDAIAFLREEIPLLPGDVYGWTKLVGEELCRYHLREHDIPSIALRFGMFVPEPFFRYGIRLLYGGVHEEDVAESVVAAISALERGDIEHDVFNVESALPFTPDDAYELRHSPLLAVERHYPGAKELLQERGVRSLKPIAEVFPVTHLRERLNVDPRHDFAEWLDDLARRPQERAEIEPPWP